MEAELRAEDRGAGSVERKQHADERVALIACYLPFAFTM